MQNYNSSGVHFLVEYFRCRSRHLNNAYRISRALRRAINKNGMNLLAIDWGLHHPQGKTISAIIEQSSITIGTAPEIGYVTINYHACGGNAKGFMKDMRIFFRPRRVRSEKPYYTVYVKNNGQTTD